MSKEIKETLRDLMILIERMKPILFMFKVLRLN